MKQALDRLDVPDSSPEAHAFGLYVHFPFCARRCDFCYYLAYDDQAHRIDAYIDALIEELSLYRERAALRDRALDFVYFGGGTPSLLSSNRLERLLGGLEGVASWRAAREVTFECAPRSVSRAKLRALRDAGVSRLSLGVQQLDDRVLRHSGRVHSAADVDRAYTAVRDIGFDIVNLDLIVGLVGETEQTFLRGLEKVIAMSPDSVTIYQLETPHYTPLYRRLHGRVEGHGEQEPELPTWPKKRARLERAFERLEQAGYRLLTAYAAVRDRRKHRFLYMSEQYRGVDLVGIGASAFSYVGGVHSQNEASLDGYLEAVSQARIPLARSFVLSDDDRLVREFVLQLKLGNVQIGAFREKFGVDITRRFAEPLSQMPPEWMRVDEQCVALTRQGLLRVDQLIPYFYAPEYQGVRYS